jgi:hypothetical protein
MSSVLENVRKKSESLKDKVFTHFNEWNYWRGLFFFLFVLFYVKSSGFEIEYKARICLLLKAAVFLGFYIAFFALGWVFTFTKESGSRIVQYYILVFSGVGLVSCALGFLGVMCLKEGTVRTAIPISDYEFPEIWTWGKVFNF